jgi:hypothetical protein
MLTTHNMCQYFIFWVYIYGPISLVVFDVVSFFFIYAFGEIIIWIFLMLACLL